jgi:hypothetical protein
MCGWLGLNVVAATVIVAGAISQGNAQTLQSLSDKVDGLNSRLNSLDARLRDTEKRWVGFGLYNDQGISNYWTRLDAERVSAESNRPGVVKFRYARKLEKRPIVVVTPHMRWGNMRLIRTSARIVESDENGFTVETYEQSDLANVEFSFVILK